MPPAPSSTELWRTIADEAAAESPLWRRALRPEPERELEPVFSPLAPPRLATGIETIYEGYLVHYGRPRLFAPPDHDAALLLGDYLYAHGLVRIASLGDVGPVRELSELVAYCAHLRGDGRDGDGQAWAETAIRLGPGAPPDGAVAEALAAHARRVG